MGNRKTRIFRLEQEEGLIHGDAELKKYITTYYKKLFGPCDHNNLVMDESYRDDIP
jgi:predicted metal-dependent hydrolase